MADYMRFLRNMDASVNKGRVYGYACELSPISEIAISANPNFY